MAKAAKSESVFGASRTTLDARIAVVKNWLLRDEPVLEVLLDLLMVLNAGVKQLTWPRIAETSPAVHEEARAEVRRIVRELEAIRRTLRPFASTSLSDAIDFLRRIVNEYPRQTKRRPRAA